VIVVDPPGSDASLALQAAIAAAQPSSRAG